MLKQVLGQKVCSMCSDFDFNTGFTSGTKIRYENAEAVEKTVSYMFRKLRLLSNMRHSPVGYPLAF